MMTDQDPQLDAPAWLARLVRKRSTMPTPTVNQDTGLDGIDAAAEHTLTEQPTLGHITGTGGSSMKRAEGTELTGAQRAEIERFNRAPNMGAFLANLYNSPYAAPLRFGADLQRAALSNPYSGGLYGGLLGYGGARAVIGLKNMLSGHPLHPADEERQRTQARLAGLAGLAGGLLLSRSLKGTTQGDNSEGQ